jgi:hypothetical protein
MIMIFLFKEYRRKLSGLLTELSSSKELILVEQEDKKHQLHVEQDYLQLVDYNLNIYVGVRSLYHADIQDYDPLFNEYVFYDNTTGEKVIEVREVLLAECIEKYLSFDLVGEYERPKLDLLRCKYFLDNGKFLREKVISSPIVRIKG